MKESCETGRETKGGGGKEGGKEDDGWATLLDADERVTSAAQHWYSMDEGEEGGDGEEGDEQGGEGEGGGERTMGMELVVTMQ